MEESGFSSRVQVAFRALDYTLVVEAGSPRMSPVSRKSTDARSLTAAEAALRNSALEFLRNVINGEVAPDAKRRRSSPRGGRAAVVRRDAQVDLFDFDGDAPSGGAES